MRTSRSRHVQAVAGLRYDRFAVDFHNNRSGADLTSVDNLVSPRLGVIYKPLEAVSVYAKYSLTFVPRAGEQLSSLSLTNQALDPEKFTNYEVGSKWDMAGGLSLTAAIYRLDRTNVVIPDPVDPTRSILVDGQRTKGVELGIGGRITESWSTVGGCLSDGAITERSSAVTERRWPSCRHTFSPGIARSSRASASATGPSIGSMFTSTDNIVALPAATRIDGSVFVTLTGARAQVNVENCSTICTMRPLTATTTSR
jgi:catecholate siderophore receptor